MTPLFLAVPQSDDDGTPDRLHLNWWWVGGAAYLLAFWSLVAYSLSWLVPELAEFTRGVNQQ